MRILLVIDSLAPGGAERSMAALAPRYAELAIELDVAYLHHRDHNVLEAFREAGATPFLVDIGALGRRRSVSHLMELVKTRRPELVHTTLFEADVLGRTAARLARVPVVSSIVNESYGPEHLADPGVHRVKLVGAQVADGASARLASRLHSLTAHAADVMARRLFYPRRRIDVIPRGRSRADLGAATPDRRARTRRALGILESDALVVAAARQEFQKGLDVLLRASRELSGSQTNLRVVIAGREGNETQHLQSLTRTLQLERTVTFLGARDDVPDLIAAADAFVVPSRREGFGSVLLEAMALGTPIVASDLGPIREVVADTALLAAPEEPASLAAAIERCLADADHAGDRSRAASTRFDRMFTTDVVGDRMLAFYQRSLGRRDHPAD